MLIGTLCPIDGTDEFDEEVYPSNFDPEQLTPEIFSARRRPDRIHYRMVRSRKSNCLRANPILDSESIRKLYEESAVHYDDLTPLVTDTYMHYAERVQGLLPDKRGILEIGCGSGEFLARMADWEFELVAGIELSREAVEKASPALRARLTCGTIDDAALEPSSFSLIAGFQVLDHLASPNEVLRSCFSTLCPGGVMYWICHDIGSWLARLLGERCPIVDIQHTVLYDKKTVAALFVRNGFEVIEQFSVANRYPFGYWVKLSPLAQFVKGPLSKVLQWSGVGRMPIAGYFGNMGIIARKPLA